MGEQTEVDLDGTVIQHWVSLISAWGYRDRSLSKAMQVVQKYALQLAERLAYSSQICETLATIVRVIERTCRMGRRRKRPMSINCCWR